MSTVVILTPIIISNWPVIVAAATGAATALGFATKQTVEQMVKEEQKVEVEQSVEIELQESQVLGESLKTGQEMVLQKGSVELRIGRDERGRCTVCAKGIGHSKTELETIAKEFTEKMTQCFVYNRVMTELKQKDFNIVNEEVTEDNDIHIHVRRWVD
jgi:hypothetical protein